MESGFPLGNCVREFMILPLLMTGLGTGKPSGASGSLIMQRLRGVSFAMVFVIGLWEMLAGVSPGVAQAENAVPGPTEYLSLEQCIRIALESNPSLMIAGERLNIAGKDVSDAYGAFLPDISLNRNWNNSDRTDFGVQKFQPTIVDSIQLRDNFTGDLVTWYSQASLPAGTENQVTNSKYKDWNGRATMNLFSGFSKFSSLSSAKHGHAAAEATLGYNRELVVQDVITAYFNLLRFQKLEEVALDAKGQATKELTRTETYFRLGSAAKSDVLQQKVRLENTKLDLVVAHNSVANAFADLAFIMNRPLAEEFAVDSSVLITDFPVESVEGLYKEALAQRLDLQSSEQQLAARRKDITSASSNLWPQVNLNGSYTRYNNESPFKFGAQESESISYGYSVSWNIFDRMRTINSRSRAKANARIAEYELEQARQNAQVEVRQLHNSLVEAKERANVSRETIEQSQEELRLARERFRVGAGTTLDVIVAQVNLANSRAQEVQAKCDFLIAQAQLNRAVGRPVRLGSP